MKDSETVYSDMNIPLIETLPLSQPHRPVDIAIVEADQQGMDHYVARVYRVFC